MAHDVFISYTSKDKPVADAVCATLEARGVRCWVAPRDVLPGEDWGEAIVRAITESRVMVLVFSSSANDSHQIKREVNLAIEREVAIAPFRIEDVMPSGSLEYYLDVTHWLDALTPPLEAHIEKLADNLTRLLAERVGSRRPAAAAQVVETPLTPTGERRSINKVLLVTSVLGVLALAALIGVLAFRWSRGGGGDGGGGRGGGGGQRAGNENRPAATDPSPGRAPQGTGVTPETPALRCNAPEYYELRCRGGGEMRLSVDAPGESGRSLLRIRFRKGSKPAPAGLNPGECAWLDRAVGSGEPDTIIRYVSGPNVPVILSLRDPNKYWGFCASNRGDHFGVTESGPSN